MKKLFFCLSFVLYHFSIFAQDNFRLFTPKLSAGVHREGVFTDLSLGFRIYEDAKSMFNTQSCFVAVGLENNYLFRKNFRLVPKVGIEYNNNVLTLRLQNRFYPNKNISFKQASWQVCPEAGLNIVGIFLIMYGYNFPITNNDIIPSLGHQVTFTLNVPFLDVLW